MTKEYAKRPAEREKKFEVSFSIYKVRPLTFLVSLLPWNLVSSNLLGGALLASGQFNNNHHSAKELLENKNMIHTDKEWKNVKNL